MGEVEALARDVNVVCAVGNAPNERLGSVYFGASALLKFFMWIGIDVDFSVRHRYHKI